MNEWLKDRQIFKIAKLKTAMGFGLVYPNDWVNPVVNLNIAHRAQILMIHQQNDLYTAMIVPLN